MADPKNIILVGFMGTGKTAVGHELGRFLDWESIDTDDLIVERCGKSIPEIFTQEGEPHFRDLETEVIRTLSERNRTVIMTGGGCVMRIDNIRALREAGMVVNLTADPEVITARCRDDVNRPLLQVDNPSATIHRLMAEREHLYAMAHHTINTSDLSIARVAMAIISLWPVELGS